MVATTSRLLASATGWLIDWHGWGWVGWSALVAIGTTLLALATGALAWFTYQVTRDSRDEIRLEQRRLESSQRPIVLPTDLEPAPQAIGDRTRAITLINAGPGAALNIVCTLMWGPPSGIVATLPQFHMRPDGSRSIRVDVPHTVDWLHVQGRVQCDDLAGVTWVTDFVIRSKDVRSEAEIDVQPPASVG